MTPIARFALVALDTDDPERLAAFYSALTGWPAVPHEDYPWWITLEAEGGATIAFQRVADYQPPTWPSGGHPQQLHLDFDVADLDEAEEQVLALGARKHDFQPGEGWRVYLDPAGHPFCLVAT
jgi:predicted enzyme related to lactoylglutathione lyase